MLTDCPDPTEVTDFHFLQLRTLRIAANNKNVPENSRNILAAASKYGLLFVGVEGGFNIIKLETVLTVDEDKENRSIVENYSYDFVPSGTPVILSVNANQTNLAVCVKCNTKVAINLYSFSSYYGSGGTWQPFCTRALSAEVRDLVWNPTIEGLYAVCLRDSSLQIHEVSGMSVAVIASVQGANAVAVCWSPKGKQLVAGKENGSFTQYKPNLAEVKTIPPPRLEENSISVTSISWIANTLFAVVYVVGDAPNLFIISTPKDSAHVYTNFYDVCLGNTSTPHQRYLLHLESSWGILLCASLDSIEIAVLGGMPNWVQWDLKEDGKALLPCKDGASNAVGMTVMYSAQRELIISESESYAPMPILFLLTDNGLLVSFHMINSNPSAVSLVSAPLPLEIRDVSAAEVSLMQQVPSTSNQSFISSTFVKGPQAGGDQTTVQKNRELVNIPHPINLTFGKIDNSTMSSVPQTKEAPILIGDAKKPDSISFSQVQPSPTNSYVGATPPPSTVEKQIEVQSNTQNSYMSAIITEIQSFVKELQDLKQLQSSTPTIDCEEDMAKLKLYALDLHNFQKEILKTMQSISSDIYTLKNVLLEGFALVEEAYSRERRRNDHSYVTMLKERALDPITAKSMKKMNQHYQYLSTQMREVNDRLDQNWILLSSDKGKKSLSNMHISSTEAIYKTIVNNQNSIHNLKKKVDLLMKKSEERKLLSTTKSASRNRYHNRSVHEDLSKLADEFLQVRIEHPEESEPTEITKKLSPGSQNILKAFLKQSDVVTVRPTVVYCPSQSRLLSNAVPSDDISVCDHDQKKDSTPKLISTPAKDKEVPGTVPSPCDAQTPKVASKLSFSFEKTPTESTHITPVYEPISPPESVDAAVPVDKSVSKIGFLGPFSGNGVPGLLMTNEKISEQQVYHPPLFKPAVNTHISTSESSAKSCTDQETGSNIKSAISSKFENPPNVTGTPLSFNQKPAESIPSLHTSLFFPKPLLSTTETLKAHDMTASNPMTIGNAVVSQSAPSFTFLSSPGLQKDVQSTVPISISTASSTKSNSLLEMKFTSENPQFSQPDIPLSQLSTNMKLPVSSTSGYSLQEANIPQLSSPLFIQPENKTSTLFPMSTDKKSDASGDKNNVGFFFQKLSDNGNKPNEPTVKTAVVSESPFPSTIEISALPLSLTKNESIESKPSQSDQTKDVLKSDQTHSTSTVLGQKLFTLNQQTESSVTTSSQPPIINKLVDFIISNFPDQKEPVSLPDTSASETSIIPTATVTSTTISETAQSTVTLPVSSENVSKSLPVVVSTVSIVSQPSLPLSKSTTSEPIPSAVTTATTGTTVFGQSASVTNTGNSVTVSNVAAITTESSVPSFGGKPAPVFGQSSPEMPSFFGTSNTFAQPSVTQPSVFGQTASNSAFPSTGGGFFSQVPSFGSTAATSTTTSSDPNNQTTTFSFGKSTFGQTSGSFGLAKSFFGQNPAPPFTQAGTTTTGATSFSFAQGSSNVFGQGSFFSGLGGKPNEENASKNVFGLNNNNNKLQSDSNNLFKNSSVTSFGAVNSGPFSSTGTFSSGGGSVVQAGFGAFQQNASPKPVSGSFGSAPSFGGAPSFGSPPAFGGSPSFGSGNALSTSVFGQQQQQQQQQQVTSNFSNFANASSPTFGSLASQSPGFGSSSPVSGGFGSQGTGFGSSPVFGGSSFGGQNSSFGSPGSPPSNSSAFTQWRN